MKKICITGQTGFIGTHLYNTLRLFPDKYDLIPFMDEYFESAEQLESIISQCDTIVHLAAMNRHDDPQVIYDTNINLVKKLINACENTGSAPHILFSSSTQEERDNLYGRSKREGREMLVKWAEKNKGTFSGLVIPNVFGPFGVPYYNSVVATFCYQLTHNETPRIDVDGKVKLIYINELVDEIIKRIDDASININELKINHTHSVNVSELLEILNKFKHLYLEQGVFPDLGNKFERNLFNTFVCYIDHAEFFPCKLKINTDDRGNFVEMIKLNSGGQVSFSTTVPGITRGNHYHIRKVERFTVIKGKASIDIRRIGTDDILSFELDGHEPAFVDMPVWYTHKITNTGTDDLLTIFWISEHYNPDDPDTFYEKV